MLRLLSEVSYDGRPVTSDRGQALLAALAAARGRAVPESDLLAAVWGPDDQPANPAKALQVVVSRTRTQTGADVVSRVAGGYRLGLPLAAVDAAELARLVAVASRAETTGDLTLARQAAGAVLATPVAPPGEEPTALGDVRDAARAHLVTAAAVLGRACSGLGEHAEALPLLEAVTEPDESTLAALLRSEAAVHGAPVALARFERHRTDVRDRLGVDPGPDLQAVHAALLAADNPVRSGVQFDATPLVGRDDDVRRLRALVRESRVTSILGPGGLGKTRLAHLLGRDADQPVVHFVELVGVLSPDDVIGEVGSALGVRDSVSGRRVLSADQRADVRGRIAQQLDAAPTLLILDNCEHVVEAVADLVAVLVATTRRLRVVTTTRAPLAITAERIFALDQLDDASAVELFTQRARAARPGVRLDDVAVRRVVARLDGLPLAIELAAAKVRAMSVDDIDRRLDDRFALLRGSDRGAPDRHQTLLAVIDWSWNLLGEPERRALRRLSVFHDGFALDAAESVLGPDALASVESLVGQSLLGVRDTEGGLRFRMLETVREFGRLQLHEAGDDAAARAAVRVWAVELCDRAYRTVFGVDQVAVVRAVAVEENNLSDTLRECLATDDRDAAVVLLAALTACWTIKGEHQRIVALLAAIEATLADWEPPPASVEPATRTAGLLVMNTAVGELPTPAHARAMLNRNGAASTDPSTRALQAVVSALDGDLRDASSWGALARLVDDPDRPVAMLALGWTSHARENSGDIEGAIETSERGLALWREEDGVWTRAITVTQLAGLYAQIGRLDVARTHATSGLEALDALEAHDDAIQLRSVLAAAAIQDGDLDEAQRLLDQMAAASATGMWGGTIVYGATRAELLLARGDLAEGMSAYEQAVVEVRELRFPGLLFDTGLEPWTLYIESAATSAYAYLDAGGEHLHALLLAKIGDLLAVDRPRIDYPVAGCVLFALGSWVLARDADADAAVPLLALASRFGYSRYSASMSWPRAVETAERLAPGALDHVLASYGDRRGADVLDAARAAVAALAE